jgi:WD40 repeat protein
VKVKSKLKGHSKRITGLAFSHVLNMLVSSGADAQVIIVQLDVMCVVTVLSCFSFLNGISPVRCSVLEKYASILDF